MADHFISSYKKIEWAEKHIRDLQSILSIFARRSDCYAVSIKAHPKQGTNFLCFKIREWRFPVDDAALSQRGSLPRDGVLGNCGIAGVGIRFS
jgi:hypothetical protein